MGIISQAIAGHQNSVMAREQREWSERMSSTAYQRSMLDMRKAGLNPMLAFQQGGAAVGGGAAGSVGGGSGDIVGSALAAYKAKQEKALIRNQVEATRQKGVLDETTADLAYLKQGTELEARSLVAAQLKSELLRHGPLQLEHDYSGSAFAKAARYGQGVAPLVGAALGGAASARGLRALGNRHKRAGKRRYKDPPDERSPRRRKMGPMKPPPRDRDIPY